MQKKNYAFTLIKELGSGENHASNPKTFETGIDKTTDQLINGDTISNILRFTLMPETKVCHQCTGSLNVIKILPKLSL